MPFLLLLVLTLTCLQRKWPAPPDWYGWPGSVVVTWSVIAALGIIAWVPARVWRRSLERDPLCRYVVVRRYHSFRRWHVYALLVAHLVAVNFAGWGWFIGDRFVHGDIATPGIDFLLLAPLFVGLMASWAAYHPLERLLAQTGFQPSADTFPGRCAYVALQLRHNLILVAPPLLLMFSQQVILALWPNLAQNDLILPLIALGLLGVMYIAVPWVMRMLLGLKPLPAGPLRERLQATARRLAFRCSDILVWNTRQTIVNAMVTGPLPVLRYVVLTDRLIDELTPEEVEAVFGHEVGHIKHHHLLFYFGFLLASMVAVVGLWETAADLLEESPIQVWVTDNLPEVADWLASYAVVSALPLLGLLALYVVVVFGYLSRRCRAPGRYLRLPYRLSAGFCVGPGEGGPAQRHSPRETRLATGLAALDDRAARGFPGKDARRARRGAAFSTARGPGEMGDFDLPGRGDWLAGDR